MRLLPKRLGVRVRPWMLKMNTVLFIFIFLLCSPILACYAYINWNAYQELDYIVIGITVGIVVVISSLAAYLVWFLQESTRTFKRLERLWRSSRMLSENGFTYEKSNKNGKRKVKFPKVYVKQGKFELEIFFEMAGNKFQERFKKIGGMLEDTFFMDLIETTDSYRYKKYRLVYSAYLNRIGVDDVVYTNDNGLRLMKNFYWDFNSDPHMLVAGGTGGGKTVFLRSVILALGKVGVVEICDPKRADFVTMSDIEAFKDRVVFEKEDIVQKFKDAYLIMMKRYDEMRKAMFENGEKELRKFYEYGFEPYFLICDEYSALMAMLDYKERNELEDVFSQYLLLGRQAGCMGIVAMQKPAREDLASKLQMNINMRIALGRLDEGGYDLAFGDANKNKEFKYLTHVDGKRVFGRGYAAIYGLVAREFYSPNVPPKFPFYDKYEKIERIKNPFSPHENADVTEDILKDESLMEFVQEVNKKQPLKSRVSVVDKESDDEDYYSDDEIEKMMEGLGDFMPGDEEKYYSLKEAAEVLDVSRPQLYKTLTIIESNHYRKYNRDENDKAVLSENEMFELKKIYALKEETGLPWNKAIDSYFDN